MSLLRQILGNLTGDIHFYVTVGKKPAIEFILKDKEILVEIKDPLLAAQAALRQLLAKPKNMARLDKLKALGFTVKIKYKMIEIEL